MMSLVQWLRNLVAGLGALSAVARHRKAKEVWYQVLFWYLSPVYIGNDTV